MMAQAMAAAAVVAVAEAEVAATATGTTTIRDHITEMEIVTGTTSLHYSRNGLGYFGLLALIGFGLMTNSPSGSDITKVRTIVFRAQISYYKLTIFRTMIAQLMGIRPGRAGLKIRPGSIGLWAYIAGAHQRAWS